MADSLWQGIPDSLTSEENCDVGKKTNERGQLIINEGTTLDIIKGGWDKKERSCLHTVFVDGYTI